VIVCEVMGRHAGWISLYSGIAGAAVAVLVPEEPFDIDEVCELLRERRSGGRSAQVVVVAEGAVPKEGSVSVTSSEVDQFGHVRLGGVGNALAAEIEKRTGFETRSVVLGHIQRGGSPTAYDRVLATRFGIAAIDALHEGAAGTMVALQADKIVRAPLSDAVSQPKLVSRSLYESVARPLFG
jgi:6-phosphofructokinase